jgi:RNA polymerase sigma-70 factor (ECF subfamily)
MNRSQVLQLIYRIAVNESLNLLRRNGHQEWMDDEVDIRAGLSNPESLATDAERSRHIQRALMNLSANDRTVLMLRHFSDCSYEEIAQILELDEKTVKSRLFEARHRLRETLKDFRPG